MLNGHDYEINVPKPIPKKTFTPIGKLVACHLYQPRELKSGITLPDGIPYNESPVGLVIAVGPDVKQVQVGQRIILNLGNLRVLWRTFHDGQETFVCNEDHVVGVLTDEYQGNTEELKPPYFN